MAITEIDPITQQLTDPSDPPLITDDESTFDAKAFARVNWQTLNTEEQQDLIVQYNIFRSQVNQAGLDIKQQNDDALIAQQNLLTQSQAAAASASESENIARSVANNKGAWSNLVGNLDVPAAVNHNGEIWSLNNDLTDVTLSEPTDLNTDWTEITGITQAEFDAALVLKADKVDTYTKTELDGGQLDNRYYTETELDAGQLDNRYSNKVDTNITVDVGAGQTYTTINAALEYLSGLYPLYKANGATATINLKAGFIMAEQVLVRGLDLGWITIVGEDSETIIDHTALTTNFTTTDYGLSSYPAFGVSKGGTSPRIGQLFRFSVEKVGGEKHGIIAVGAGSSADVLSGKGFIGAGTFGIYAASGSTINAEGANASNAGSIGIRAYKGSTINAEGANASNAGSVGIYAFKGSTINAEGANASNAVDYCFSAVYNSSINAKNALVQNQTTGANCIRVVDGSTIEASSINTTGSTVPVLSQAVNTLTGNGIIYQ